MIHNALSETISLDDVWDFVLGEEQRGKSIHQAAGYQGYPKLADRPACYRKEVHIPAGWASARVFAESEAVSYAAQLPANRVVGRPQEICTIALPLPALETAQEYHLEARITGRLGEIANEWPLWSFPTIVDWPTNTAMDGPSAAFDCCPELVAHATWANALPEERPLLVVSSALSIWTVDYLRRGGRVLLLQ